MNHDVITDPLSKYKEYEYLEYEDKLRAISDLLSEANHLCAESKKTLSKIIKGNDEKNPNRDGLIIVAALSCSENAPGLFKHYEETAEEPLSVIKRLCKYIEAVDKERANWEYARIDGLVKLLTCKNIQANLDDPLDYVLTTWRYIEKKHTIKKNKSKVTENIDEMIEVLTNGDFLCQLKPGYKAALAAIDLCRIDPHDSVGEEALIVGSKRKNAGSRRRKRKIENNHI